MFYTNQSKYTELMKPSDSKNILKLAKFVYEALNARIAAQNYFDWVAPIMLVKVVC